MIQNGATLSALSFVVDRVPDFHFNRANLHARAPPVTSFSDPNASSQQLAISSAAVNTSVESLKVDDKTIESLRGVWSEGALAKLKQSSTSDKQQDPSSSSSGDNTSSNSGTQRDLMTTVSTAINITDLQTGASTQTINSKSIHNATGAATISSNTTTSAPNQQRARVPTQPSAVHGKNTVEFSPVDPLNTATLEFNSKDLDWTSSGSWSPDLDYNNDWDEKLDLNSPNTWNTIQSSWNSWGAASWNNGNWSNSWNNNSWSGGSWNA
jgi:hypothetical protein